MTSTVSTHMIKICPDIASNHSQATQAIREECIKPKKLALAAKYPLGGSSGPGEGGRKMCLHSDDDSQVANYKKEIIDDAPL